MGIFKKIYAVALHIWFYVLIFIVTVLIAPLLLLFLIRDADYPKFYWLARNIWANFILYGMGIYPKIINDKKHTITSPSILVANHSSMLDIMLMYRVSKNPLVFVGKKELTNYPIFGYFYSKVSIVVDRKNIRSRYAVYESANKYLAKKYSICIFPEGGVPAPNVFLGGFKEGAFRLARDKNLDVVTLAFLDNKQRMPYRLTVGSSGKARAVLIDILSPSNYDEENKRALKTDCRELIFNTLEDYRKNEKLLNSASQ